MTRLLKSIDPLHALAWAVALAAFPLVWMGGLVTSHGAGLSVPDWPNTFGYNMFLVPWDRWLGPNAGGVFYEHAHRLLGTVVGLLAIALTLFAWGPARHPATRRGLQVAALATAGVGLATTLVLAYGMVGNFDLPASPRALANVPVFAWCVALVILIASVATRRHPSPAARWGAAALLVAICVQGVIGGTRVTETNLSLAFLHGVFGQLVFAGAAATVLLTSRAWRSATGRRRDPMVPRGLARLLTVVAVLVVAQLVLGALMRHDPQRGVASGGAGLAIPDWPLHYGRVLPPTNAIELKEANEYRTFELGIRAVSAGQVWLHFAHRANAYLTASVAVFAGAWTLARLRGRLFRALGALLIAGVLTQVTLGVLTVLYRKPADVATAHQATGAVLLAVTTCAALLAWRRAGRPSVEVIDVKLTTRRTAQRTATMAR